MKDITVQIGAYTLKVEDGTIKIHIFTTYGQFLSTELTEDAKEAFILFGALLIDRKERDV